MAQSRQSLRCSHKNQLSSPYKMAAHVRLKNEFTEDEKLAQIHLESRRTYFKALVLLFLHNCLSKFEPPHDKTNKMICAPSEDSDQPGHPPSLIRVFAVCPMGS